MKNPRQNNEVVVDSSLFPRNFAVVNPELDHNKDNYNISAKKKLLNLKQRSSLASHHGADSSHFTSSNVTSVKNSISPRGGWEREGG